MVVDAEGTIDGRDAEKYKHNFEMDKPIKSRIHWITLLRCIPAELKYYIPPE